MSNNLVSTILHVMEKHVETQTGIYGSGIRSNAWLKNFLYKYENFQVHMFYL